jgi:tetratricopeptide (TPR) repeat protein
MAVFGHELSLTLALARDIPRARRWGEEVLPLVVKASAVFEAMLRRPLTLIYALSGEIDKAREACEAVERIESRTLLGCVYEDACGVGLHYLRCGELERARGYLERLLPLYEDRSNLAAVAACGLVLGNVYLELGRHAKAGELLTRSLEISRDGGNALLQAWALPLLCDVCLAVGQRARAEEHVRRGFELLVPEQRWYGAVAPLHAARGRLAAAAKLWDDAIRDFETAIAINRQSELPWDEAHALRHLAHVQRERNHAGDRERARLGLNQALEIFTRVGARKDVEKVAAS